MTTVTLIESQKDQSFKVLVNDKAAYTPFTYADFDSKEAARKLAKACTFDEALKAQMDGKVKLAYHVV